MYHIEKNTVQETLIIPLFGRKVCSEHFPHLSCVDLDSRCSHCGGDSSGYILVGSNHR